MSEEQQVAEAIVRALRDAIYEKPSTDNNWEHCKENWMRPDSARWLHDQMAKRSPSKYPHFPN